MQVSAVIIAFNEEDKIADAISSVRWADEVLVVDSESTDRTRDIAAELGARVIVQPWQGFSEQKQFAADSASNDWILSLDADERVTPALRDEIGQLPDRPSADGFTIPRLSVYMGREIRHGGWYPDRQLRLFDRRKGRWNGRIIHESFKLSGDATPGILKGDLLHYSVDGPAHHAAMIAVRYAPLAAQQMEKEGKRTSFTNALVAGWAAFIRHYFLKLGFLDGVPGFCIAWFAAHHARLKHLILLESHRKKSG